MVSNLDNKDQTKKPPHRFQKGICPNPAGRPTDPLRFMKAGKYVDFLRELAETQQLDVKTLEQMSKSTTIPAYRVIMARVLFEASKGKDRFIDLLWNRLYGRPREHVEVTIPKPTIIERLDGSQVVAGILEGEVIEPKDGE